MKTIPLALATSMLTAAFGCSTLSSHATSHLSAVGNEIRGGTPVRATRARDLMSGPALIKHLDTGGDGTMTLYLADDPGIGDRTCPSAATEQVSPIAILRQASRVTDLSVPRGKRVCAVVTDARSMDVTWHAQAITAKESEQIELALAGPPAKGPHIKITPTPRAGPTPRPSDTEFDRSFE